MLSMCEERIIIYTDACMYMLYEIITVHIILSYRRPTRGKEIWSRAYLKYSLLSPCWLPVNQKEHDWFRLLIMANFHKTDNYVFVW